MVCSIFQHLPVLQISAVCGSMVKLLNLIRFPPNTMRDWYGKSAWLRTYGLEGHSLVKSARVQSWTEGNPRFMSPHQPLPPGSILTCRLWPPTRTNLWIERECEGARSLHHNHITSTDSRLSLIFLLKPRKMLLVPLFASSGRSGTTCLHLKGRFYNPKVLRADQQHWLRWLQSANLSGWDDLPFVLVGLKRP